MEVRKNKNAVTIVIIAIKVGIELQVGNFELVTRTLKL